MQKTWHLFFLARSIVLLWINIKFLLLLIITFYILHILLMPRDSNRPPRALAAMLLKRDLRFNIVHSCFLNLLSFFFSFSYWLIFFSLLLSSNCHCHMTSGHTFTFEFSRFIFLYKYILFYDRSTIFPRIPKTVIKNSK